MRVHTRRKEQGKHIRVTKPEMEQGRRREGKERKRKQEEKVVENKIQITPRRQRPTVSPIL
jgi:hypothetical protein